MKHLFSFLGVLLLLAGARCHAQNFNCIQDVEPEIQAQNNFSTFTTEGHSNAYIPSAQALCGGYGSANAWANVESQWIPITCQDQQPHNVQGCINTETSYKAAWQNFDNCIDYEAWSDQWYLCEPAGGWTASVKPRVLQLRTQAAQKYHELHPE